MFLRIAPPAIIKALFRGTWWSASTRRLIRYNLSIWWRSLCHCKISTTGYPAHLHINLQTGIQGHGIGRQLINQFLAQLHEAGIPGVQLSARADNIAAIGFFEKMGFKQLGRCPILRVGPGVDDIRYSVIMVREINAECKMKNAE